MRRPTTQTLVFAQFALSLCAYAATNLFWMFPRDNPSFAGAVLLFASVAGVLAFVVWRPNWRKATLGLAAVAVSAIVAYGGAALNRVGVRVFFSAREPQMSQFANAFSAYGRIRDMSDGQRFYQSLNGQLVAVTAADGSTAGSPEMRAVLPLADVLARDNIPATQFAAFQRELVAMRLISVERTPNGIALLHDGMLDNLEGFLFVPVGAKPPAVGSELFETKLVSLVSMRGGWYYFVTT